MPRACKWGGVLNRHNVGISVVLEELPATPRGSTGSNRESGLTARSNAWRADLHPSVPLVMSGN